MPRRPAEPATRSRRTPPRPARASTRPGKRGDGAAPARPAKPAGSAGGVKPKKRATVPLDTVWRRLSLRLSSQRPDVGDHTRLVLRRRNRSVLGLGATIIAGAVLAAVLVLPVRAWLNQRDELAARNRELAALDAANEDLAAQNDRLRTAQGIKDAARQDLGLIEDGETVIAMLPAPVTELMPIGWPYSVVGQILTVRQASAILAAATTTAPATTTATTTATTVAPG